MVVMALLGGLMSLVAMFMQHGRNYASDAETYSRVQRSATLALRRITDDIYTGSGNFLQCYGDSLVFLSSRSPDPQDSIVGFHETTGRVLWKSWLCHYYDAQEQVVIRAELPLTLPISEPGELPEPTVGPATFRTQSSVRRTPIAQNVQAFEVTRAGPTVMVKITCHDETPVPQIDPARKAVEVTVNGEISLIN